ncbi:MAG: aspartate-semialdehyde dehydrogenase [Deltaproteobacteria bacterium]|nr:aspartate-semialdehyde dehydrogenase [Deltaproteobacteria bacterium]
MSEKIPVGVIGATGMVGQNYVRLLSENPWFEVVYLAASPRSAGKRYREAVEGRWHMATDIPGPVADRIVEDGGDVDRAAGRCRVVFSAVDMEKEAVRLLEAAYAAAGIAVVSNNSAHRQTGDVPIIIPEVNPGHCDIIPVQQRRRGWSSGLIVVKPNCSVQSYMIPVHALMQRGYRVAKMIVTTLQGLSGAGYPGPSALDLTDNIIPYIPGEEEKSEAEPQKIFGRIEGDRIVPETSIAISAHCTRVPVIDGHSACVSIQFQGPKPSLQEIEEAWCAYRSVPQELGLPSAPMPPIIVRNERDRPQPRRDRDAGKGMAVVVGRLRECRVFDFRFVGLSHNTVRGAAGGAILMAELLRAKGFLE